jgi:hypothetical protein
VAESSKAHPTSHVGSYLSVRTDLQVPTMGTYTFSGVDHTELARVADAWTTLSESIRRTVISLVEAS